MGGMEGGWDGVYLATMKKIRFRMNLPMKAIVDSAIDAVCIHVGEGVRTHVHMHAYIYAYTCKVVNMWVLNTHMHKHIPYP